DLLLMNPTTGIAGCCARTASGQAAAAPPSSVMNWRRLRSSMGSSPEPAEPAYRRLRMPRKRPQVLGVDLNRSESGRLISVLDFQDFSVLFGKPCSRFASRCSGFG